MNSKHTTPSRRSFGVIIRDFATEVAVRFPSSPFALSCAVLLLPMCLLMSSARAGERTYRNVGVTISIDGIGALQGAKLAEPLSRKAAYSETDRSGGSSTIGRPSTEEVVISGSLPVPEAVEKWFADAEKGKTPLRSLAVEVFDSSGKLVCDWKVSDALPIRLIANLSDSLWFLRLRNNGIQYRVSNGGSHATTSYSGGAPSNEAASAGNADTRARNSGDSGNSRTLPPNAAAPAGGIRNGGNLSGIRAPAQPGAGGAAYAVTTASGKVYHAIRVIPNADRSQYTLVLSDQKRVTLDRAEIKKTEPVAMR